MGQEPAASAAAQAQRRRAGLPERLLQRLCQGGLECRGQLLLQLRLDRAGHLLQQRVPGALEALYTPRLAANADSWLAGRLITRAAYWQHSCRQRASGGPRISNRAAQHDTSRDRPTLQEKQQEREIDARADTQGCCQASSSWAKQALPSHPKVTFGREACTACCTAGATAAPTPPPMVASSARTTCHTKEGCRRVSHT